MPIYDEQQISEMKSLSTGDLYIHFNIIFPKYINPEVKDEIIKILDQQ